MLTARLLAVSSGMHYSWGGTWSWGVYLVPGGVPGPQEGVFLVPGEVYLVPGVCTWSGTPPPRGLTQACKHITLPQTSFEGGN